MTTIAQQIRELQTRPAAQLVEHYEALFGKPPRVRNAAWLRRQVAWKLQERALGGLSERGRSRLEALIAQIDLPIADTEPTPRTQAKPATSARGGPLVGTVLTRRWRELEIRVTVRDDGFEWNGSRYRSLSAVAKAITGASWNGHLFFGLTQRRARA